MGSVLVHCPCCNTSHQNLDVGVPLELHQPTVERMREHYGKRGVELNQARLRMATLPATAQVLVPLLWPATPARALRK